mmetsp:Transcript_42958/g.102183  ORF Transcript_42958/g.102183 Transcript_42958/m.102183 type:complete len:337 (+) Transcript_42958:2454-3464(+)
MGQHPVRGRAGVHPDAGGQHAPRDPRHFHVRPHLQGGRLSRGGGQLVRLGAFHRTDDWVEHVAVTLYPHVFLLPHEARLVPSALGCWSERAILEHQRHGGTRVPGVPRRNRGELRESVAIRGGLLHRYGPVCAPHAQGPRLPAYHGHGDAYDLNISQRHLPLPRSLHRRLFRVRMRRDAAVRAPIQPDVDPRRLFQAPVGHGADDGQERILGADAGRSANIRVPDIHLDVLGSGVLPPDQHLPCDPHRRLWHPQGHGGAFGADHGRGASRVVGPLQVDVSSENTLHVGQHASGDPRSEEGWAALCLLSASRGDQDPGPQGRDQSPGRDGDHAAHDA